MDWCCFGLGSPPWLCYFDLPILNEETRLLLFFVQIVTDPEVAHPPLQVSSPDFETYPILDITLSLFFFLYPRGSLIGSQIKPPLLVKLELPNTIKIKKKKAPWESQGEKKGQATPTSLPISRKLLASHAPCPPIVFLGTEKLSFVGGNTTRLLGFPQDDDMATIKKDTPPGTVNCRVLTILSTCDVCISKCVLVIRPPHKTSAAHCRYHFRLAKYAFLGLFISYWNPAGELRVRRRRRRGEER